MSDANKPGEELPPMSSDALDTAAVAALFRDVAALTEVDEVLIKPSREMVDDQRTVSVEQALDLLLNGSVRGVQLRYRHDGSHWWDTLMPEGNGFRLVRVKHDFT